jgi:hypothetical protein
MMRLFRVRAGSRRESGTRFLLQFFLSSDLVTGANQECGSEDNQGAESESFDIVLSPALDLAVEEPRFRVRAYGGDERE